MTTASVDVALYDEERLTDDALAGIVVSGPTPTVIYVLVTDVYCAGEVVAKRRGERAAWVEYSRPLT